MGYPEDKMTEEQAEVVKTALIQKIDQSESKDPIQFSAAEFENGGLAFTCANRATKFWLHTTALKLIPWPGARLLVGQAELMLKGNRFILWLFKIMKKRDNPQLLDLFQKQNKGMSTAEWKVLRRVPEVKDKMERERVTLWVDDKSVEYLKVRNFQLFLGLGRAIFLPSSEWRKQQSVPNSTKQYNVGRVLHGSEPQVPRLFRGPGLLSVPPPRRLESSFEGRYRPQRREPAFAFVNPPHFREAQFLDSNRPLLWGQVFLDSPLARFEFSEQPRGRGFGLSEKSLLRESVFAGPDRAQPRESIHISDRPLENRYLTSGRQQGEYVNQLSPREARYAALDQPPSLGSRYSVSDRALSPKSRFAPSDRPQSRDSVYLTSSRDQSQNSRFGGLDELLLQGSRFRGSDQMRTGEGRFEEPNSLYSRRSNLSDHAEFGEFSDTFRMSHSREERFSGSDFQQPHQSASSYVSWTDSRFSRPSDSRRANW